MQFTNILNNLKRVSISLFIGTGIFHLLAYALNTETSHIEFVYIILIAFSVAKLYKK